MAPPFHEDARSDAAVVECFLQLGAGRADIDSLGEEALDRGTEAAPALHTPDVRPLMGDEDAAPWLGDDVVCANELAVGLRDRVRVDDEVFRDRTHARQALPRSELPAQDRSPDLVDDLTIDRERAPRRRPQVYQVYYVY
jgi:hypothetical protein